MENRWVPEAADDLERLYHFLEEKSIEATEKAIEAIMASAEMLAENPRIGKPFTDGTHRRELFIPFGAGNYVLRYIIDRDAVVIIRVWLCRESRQD